MRIIFLDIDGVLNSKQWHESEECKTFGTSVKRHFSPNCIKQLNTVIEETQAKIIISSSWRLFKTLQELKDILKSVGFKGRIYGKTTSMPIYNDEGLTCRGLEIQEWIKDQQKNFKTPIQYIILDDESDFLKSQQKYFFQTNPNVGLDTSLAEKVIAFFK